jgi:hypothetical protein
LGVVGCRRKTKNENIKKKRKMKKRKKKKKKTKKTKKTKKKGYIEIGIFQGITDLFVCEKRSIVDLEWVFRKVCAKNVHYSWFPVFYISTYYCTLNSIE